MADNNETATQDADESNTSATSLVKNETSSGGPSKNTEMSVKSSDSNDTGVKLIEIVNDASNNIDQLEESTDPVKKDQVEDGKTASDTSGGESAMKSCQDVSLKHLADRYTCIGPAQLISKPVSTTSHTPINETVVSKEEKSRVNSKTVKYVIRNVTKSSKIVKVSNLDYCIKPVRKNIFPGKNQKIQYPIIFIGEPLFVDADDYKDPPNDAIKNNQPLTISETILSQSEIKEESLYNITLLRDSFVSPSDFKSIKTKIRKFFYPTPDLTQPTFVRQMNIPFPHQPIVSHKPGFNMPRNFVINSNLSNTNNGMVHIVARTVPSATLASSVFSTVKHTSHKTLLPRLQTPTINRNVKPIIHIQTKKPITKPNNLATMSAVIVPKPILTPQVAMSSKPLLKLKPIPALKPISAKVPTSLTLKSNQNVMQVKILPSMSNAVGAKVQTVSSGSKTPMPLQILSSSNASRVITVSAGGSGVLMSKKPATAIFVPTKTNKGEQCVSTAPKAAEKKNSPVKLTEYASAALTEIVNKHRTDVVKTNSISSPQILPVKPKVNHNRPLREGVEVTFEDGVRHFITSLRQITYLDDEPVKSWTDLRKGVKVAAKWTDGLIYDATVVSCYFSADKNTLTTSETKAKLQKIDSEPSPKLPSKKQKLSTIACTNCKKIFASLKVFRKHQKRVCKGQGVIVRNGTCIETEKVLPTGIANDWNPNAKDSSKPAVSDKAVEKTELSPPDSARKVEGYNIVKNAKGAQKRKASSLNIREKNDDKLVKKKRKISANMIQLNKNVLDNEKLVTKTPDANFIFEKGTRFLHRWQLDDGGSKWYQGEVIKVLSTPESILECEFEVLYKGENEAYNLKLYEDYPADIRIMGRS